MNRIGIPYSILIMICISVALTIHTVMTTQKFISINVIEDLTLTMLSILFIIAGCIASSILVLIIRNNSPRRKND